MSYRRFFAVLDTETTGIPEKNPLARILEVGAVVLDDRGERVDVFCRLCNPGERFLGPEADEALAINGITREMVRRKPLSWQVGAELRVWLIQRQVSTVTAWGMDFDFDTLLLGAPEWLQPIMPPLRRGPCVREWTKRHLGVSRPRPSLPGTMGHLEMPRNGQPHHALSDALDAADIAARILRLEDGRREERLDELFPPRDLELSWRAAHPAADGASRTLAL